jgi:hypothetical protein
MNLTDWHRRMAAMVAAGNPLTPATPIRASGNHLVAAQDEPEPDETLRAMARKAEAAAALEQRNALRLQVQHGDGWGH